MKSSSEKNFISQKELENVLAQNSSAEEKARVKKILDDCVLSKEAVAGFALFPSAIDDIPALKKSIAIKSGMTTSIWMNVLIFGFGISLLIGIGYIALTKKSNSQIVMVKHEMTIAASTNSQKNSVTELNPQAEHFVNPEMNVIHKTKTSTKVFTDSTNEKSNFKNPIATNEPLKRIDTIIPIRPIIPIQAEIGYNASVGFICDLKVTEFENYYRKTIDVYEPNLSGIPAEFADEKSKKENDEQTLRTIPADQFLTQGLQAFHDGHYGRCIEKMEVLKKSNPNDLNAIFYIGVSDVKLEMFAKAIPLFDQILNSPNNVFHEEANWYKALALIGNGNVDAAKKVLMEISLQDGFYKEKAAQKLKDIK